MIRVALVDDDLSCIEILEGALRRYGKENGEEFRISKFINGVNFISEYTSEYDFVLMDIDMPHLNGLETAKLLRKVDSRVALIFVTNLANYAIKGYEVEAVDYIVKPIDVNQFCSKLKRIISRIKKDDDDPYLSVVTRLGTTKIFLSEIYYITTQGRYVLLHTKIKANTYHAIIRAPKTQNMPPPSNNLVKAGLNTKIPVLTHGDFVYKQT